MVDISFTTLKGVPLPELVEAVYQSMRMVEARRTIPGTGPSHALAELVIKELEDREGRRLSDFDAVLARSYTAALGAALEAAVGTERGIDKARGQALLDDLERQGEFRVSRPNTHAIWDPGWARSVTEHSYKAQTALGRELVRYGADLLMRALRSAPDAVPDHVLLSVLFRHALSAFDATLVALEAAAPSAASVHVRAQLEARWGLKLALSEPTKWGRHVYVWSLRQQRVAATYQMINPTEAAELANQMKTSDLSRTGSAPTQVDWIAYVDHIGAILARPEYRDIDESSAKYAAVRKHEPPWHYDASRPKGRQLVSARQLAQAVGAEAEYDRIYKHSSYYVHGAFTGTSLISDDKGLIVAPLRTAEGWRQLYLLSVGLAVESYRLVINQYREGEVGTFVRGYHDRWRAIIEATPDIDVVISSLVNP